MPRVKKNQALQAAMCDRFVILTEQHLKLPAQELQEALGYQSPATLRQIRTKRNTFPEPDKLAALGRLRTRAGESPNLHWLLTGEGLPLITNPDESAIQPWMSDVLSFLDAEKAQALLTLINEGKAEERSSRRKN